MMDDERGPTSSDEPLRTPVSHFMAANVATVSRGLLIEDAAQRIVENHVSGMPVVDDHGTIVGVVSLTDLVRALLDGPTAPPPAESSTEFYDPLSVERLVESLLEGREGGGRIVADVMSRRLLTVGPDATLLDAARMMAKHRVHRVLVVDDTLKLHGILSALDVVAAVAA
ncbi:MAG: CBS domain-containing protein [Polyangiaceae bacterium]|jgi:CBS domain-containing protein|nr:CBS domain-containing protein [Polyangiaceae bacterium]MBK8938726.1 CBS domain-containing protein [Polyangiaceae bacterium]